jgi:hypothetical protein
MKRPFSVAALIFPVAVFLLPAAADAQSAETGAAARKTVQIVRTANAPELDGSLDDPAWQAAAVISELRQYKPEEFAEPTERSTFLLMYDDDYLYVGVKAFETNPENIIARQLVQGGELRYDDTVGIILDPFDSHRTGYRFLVNPHGVRSEATYDNPSEPNFDWAGIWDARTKFDVDGWSAEIKIPFKTLNFDPDKRDWGLTLERHRVGTQEHIAWTFHNRNINPGTTGIASGFDGLTQGRGLDVIPSASLRSSRDFTNDSSDSELEPSIDVFYKITPQMTAALTINTDFSATEVDDRQVNLSRFSLFFPEKREFFLQDADIFRFGNLEENGIPFHSRRIGLSDDGQPIDIIAGLKLTGRTGPWNIGLVDVLQDENAGVPRSNLIVARVARNVLGESSIGAIITHGNATEDIDSSLVGADFRYRNTQVLEGKTVEGQLWYQKSDTQGVSGEDAAWGAGIGIDNENGFWGEAGVKTFEANFDPALGFINRSGIRKYNIFGGYTRWPNGERIAKIRSFLGANQIEDANGELETRELHFFPISIQNHAGDEFEVSIKNTKEVLVDGFEIVPGVEILPGTYTFTRYEIDLSREPHRKFAPALEVEAGDFFDGKRIDTSIGANWRPNEHLNIELEAVWSDVDLPAGEFTTRLYQARINYAINARWAWLNFLQYDNLSEEMGINSRLRWIPQAGREAFFVINRGFVRDSGGSFHSKNSELVLRASYTFRY